MKKVLLSMLLISSFANAETSLKETDVEDLRNNDYAIITNDSYYQQHMEKRKEELLKFKNSDLKDATQNNCFKKPYYYCEINPVHILEQLNGNLVYPEMISIEKNQKETMFAAAADFGQKKQEMYTMDVNEDFNKKFTEEYVPAFKNFYNAITNDYIIMYPIYGNIIIDGLHKNIDSPKNTRKGRIASKAALIYLSEGKEAKNTFLDKEITEVLKEEKIELMKAIEKRKTK